ncbi:MAG: GntR family transcriptional regulator [Bryobacterales bacterium]|nr:GntR family transcriptional regulator [Bryobacterales bacterium]
MPIAPVKVQSVTLRHQIVSQIRQAILDGSLRPGERVVERTLASGIGASVTAVREAVIQLEAEGLITKRSNTATNITSLTDEEIAQTFAVRHTLERMAVEEAANHATTAGIRLLKQLHAAAREAAVAQDRQLYVQRDFAWHDAVWSTSGNQVLTATLRRLVLPLFGFSVVQTVLQKDFDLIEDVQLHTPILQAIARKDAVAAVSAFDKGIRVWTTHVRERPNTGRRARHA